MAISGVLPVKTPIKKFARKIFGGSPREQFFDTMTTSQDMNEIDLFGEKLSKKAQLFTFFYPSPSKELP